MNRNFDQESRNTIILVRHGESTFNRDGIIQGQTNDSILTERGIEQAVTIGKWLRGIDISGCMCSPLARAEQTTSIIAEKIGYPISRIRKDQRLIEIDFGSWTGQQRKVVENDNLDLYQNWRRRPYDFSLGNAFPVRELYERLSSVSEELTNPKNRTGNLLIVGHRGTVSGLVVSLLKLPKSHHHFLQIDRGSVTIIRECRRTESEIDYELFCANARPIAIGAHPVDFQTEERTKSFGEVFLVRHGQTASNIDRRYQGSQDVDLSEMGEKNVQLLSESFKPRIPTRMFSSPLKRAKASAEILSNEFGIKTISQRKDLHEFQYGVWEGMSEEDVQKYRSSEYSQWKAAPVDTEIPKAEHINDAYNRCRGVWDFFEKDIITWKGSIISVAHDIVNRLLICNALDLPASYIWKFKQTNAAVSVLAVKQTYDGKLRMLNHSPYSLQRRLSDEWL
jgi:phosphoserine phosphatase